MAFCVRKKLEIIDGIIEELCKEEKGDGGGFGIGVVDVVNNF